MAMLTPRRCPEALPLNADHAQLLTLLTWMSPAFPTGSFAYSHGLEQAIADGRIGDGEGLVQWIADLLARGSGWTDALLFARCWHEDTSGLNTTALALCSSAERHLETTQLGRSFQAAAAVWTGDAAAGDAMAYPVAAGTACKTLGIDPEPALVAFLQGFCTALVSVAVRLVPLGQTQGLWVLRQLSPVISATALRACAADLSGLGGVCLAADIAAMQHETLEPRIFRT